MTTTFRPAFAALISTILVLVPAAVSAAVPASGELTQLSGDIGYDAGPFYIANTGTLGFTTITCLSALPQLCDSYKLTVTLPAGYKAQHPDAEAVVSLSWQPAHGNIDIPGVDVPIVGEVLAPATVPDYDLYAFEGDVPNSYGADLILTTVGPVPYRDSASSANPEVMHLPVKDGSKVYTLKTIPFAPTGEPVHVQISLNPGATTGGGGGGGGGGPSYLTFGAGDAPAAAKPRFQVFAQPPATEDSNQENGEFNIGFNPRTGNIMAMSVTFPGAVFAVTPPEVATPGAPESGPAVWSNRSSLWRDLPQAVGDPILWTDQETGRTFEANLVYGPNISYAFSDDDGQTWTNLGISGIMGTDHETIASGPYPDDPTAAPFEALAEQNGYVGANGKGRAVYYCSQDNPAVWVSVLPEGVPGHNTQNNCVRSDDGGLTWGPVQVAADGSDCGLQHGHLHISNDGVAYLPNRHCTATQGGAYSADAGLTWQIFHVPAATAGDSGADPSIGIDADNTLYFCYVKDDGTAHVQVGHRNPADNTLHWGKDTDIGLARGVVKANFVEAVGGDSGRAACGFIGTNMAGNAQALDFEGVWYAFIATTYDGGETWTTVNATPNDPVQAAGGIWLQGGDAVNRNLLDFNEITLDDKGRVIYGFNDGCVSIECIADPTYAKPGHDSKEFKAKMRVARQTGGKTLKAAFDSTFAAPRAPGRPYLSGVPDTGGFQLSWTAPDHGGFPITGYTVTRTPTGTTGTAKTFTTTDKLGVIDADTSNGAGYTYVVTATNAQHLTSAPSNVLGASDTGPTESACVAPGITIFTDASGDQTGSQAGLATQADIESLRVSEPYVDDTDKSVSFTLKVHDLMDTQGQLQPNTTWRVYFDTKGTDGQTRTVFVQMSTANLLDADPTTGSFVTYNYGYSDSGTTTQDNSTNVVQGSYGPDGTIVLKLKTDVTLPFCSATSATCTSANPDFSVRLTKGSVLSNFSAEVNLLAGALGSGFNRQLDSANGTASYTLLSNAYCAPNHPPVATLSADHQSGDGSLSVTFTVGAHDQDAVDSVSYVLQFGDGEHATGTGDGTVSHTYGVGSHTASLTVTDSRGAKSIAGLPIVVTAPNSAPTASLTPSSAAVIDGDSVTFTVSGSDPDQAANTLTYDLDFHDGVHYRSSGTASHSFTGVGSHTVTLTVTDAQGATGTASAAVTVRADQAPSATLTPSTASIAAGEAVPFVTGGSDPDANDALTFDLNYGDGAHSNLVGDAGHTYATAGSYTATLTVTDSHGRSATASSTVTVTQPTNAAQLSVTLTSDPAGGADQTYDVTSGPLSVTFSAQVSNSDGTPLRFTIAFGDGQNSTATMTPDPVDPSKATYTYQYQYAGTYHPYVTATQDYGSRAAASGMDDDIIQTTTHVSVGSVAAAYFTLKNIVYGEDASTHVRYADVTFDTTGSVGDTYGIDFGDGAVVQGTGRPAATVTHRYNAAGDYVATLSMTDGQATSDGSVHTVSQSQPVRITARQVLTAQLKNPVVDGTTSPVTAQFDGCLSLPAGDGTAITTYVMTYGDGTSESHDATTANACKFTHTYTATTSTTYKPTLTVYDDATPVRTNTSAPAKVLVTAPAQKPGLGGGGGGSLGFLTLLPLMVAARVRRRTLH